MDGVFMKKLLKIMGICTLAALLLWCGSVLADRKTLGENVIRLHVVANSDTQADQAVKLEVRDAVTAYIAENLDTDLSQSQAKAWLEDNLDELTAVANIALSRAGFVQEAQVSLRQEAFPLRQYDTFALPSGVYDSLRITIGAGEGRNWWCVIFPSLCVSAASQDAADTAVGAGFSQGLAGAVSGQPGYEIRFFFLDWLGKIENYFFGR